MNTRFLFPHRFKLIGWILLIPSVGFGIYCLFINTDELQNVGLKGKMFAIYSNEFMGKASVLEFVDVNWLPSVIGIMVIVGAIFAGFSREKNEDEYIAKVRLESLLWGVYINYGLLIFCFLFFWGLPFFNVMTFSMFTVLLIFLVRFNFIMYRNKKSTAHEK